jgi:hypothetical protein
MKPDCLDKLTKEDFIDDESITDEDYYSDFLSIKFNTSDIGGDNLRILERFLNVLYPILWSKEQNRILVKILTCRPNNISLILIKRIVSCICNNIQIKGNVNRYLTIEFYKGNCLNDSSEHNLICQDYLTPGSGLDANKIINAIYFISNV